MQEKKKDEKKDSDAHVVNSVVAAPVMENGGSASTSRDATAVPKTAAHQDSTEPESGTVQCIYYGRYGHIIEKCFIRLRVLRLLNGEDDTQDGDNKGSRSKKHAKGRKGKFPTLVINQAIADQRTLMYTPASIGGIKFARCLIDTGTEANVISIADTMKHGFAFALGGIQEL